MTPKQADKIAAKVKDKRFGLLMENGVGVWIYECKAIKYCGSDCHLKRYRGSFWLHWGGHRKHSKHIYKGKDKWEGFTLAWELYRTDWKVTIITEAVLDTILADKSR